MQQKLEFPQYTFFVESEHATATSGGYIVSAEKITIPLPFEPSEYYLHGWQSWSLCAWVPATYRIFPQRPFALHPMQTDPVYAFESAPNGSHVCAVAAPDGNILLLGALGLETHVQLNGKQLTGWSEAGRREWLVAFGKEQEVFAHYASHLEGYLGKGRVQKAPRVWCSWYSLYTEIYEEQLLKILDDLADLPFDVFQVDDGWQKAIGDWEPNAKFPHGMDGLAAKINASGRRAGLWLAPLLVVPSSETYRQHPDWLLHDENGKLVSAGSNWNEPLYALDTTHPEALDWLARLMRKVRSWGYDYAKLDFLYAGALPGKRCNDMPREAAYRNGLKVIREALGDAYFLTCGAPVIPSIGLCDGIRIGPDVAEYWASERDDLFLNNFTTPGTRNGLRTSLNRLWLAPLVNTDPDVVYFRSLHATMTEEQKKLMQDFGKICRFTATSDLPAWWTEAERATVKAYLLANPRIERTGRYAFRVDGQEIDFGSHISIPKHNWKSKIISGIVGPASDSATVRNAVSFLAKQRLKKIVKDTR